MHNSIRSSRLQLLVAMTLQLALGICQGQERVLAFDRGWVRSDGNRTQNTNTFTGINGQGRLNTYFAFDLREVSGVVTSAAIRVRLINYLSPDASEPYVMVDVTNAIHVVTNLSASSAEVDTVFSDLESGAVYAAGSMTARPVE
ncbi:MAG: hypothetical protein O3A51_05600 [Verrucomicrobia bacterium]|nr:hypothetical protein [Verrucomicrobiota bacterium]